jgi:hypothetical protein
VNENRLLPASRRMALFPANQKAIGAALHRTPPITFEPFTAKSNACERNQRE